MKFCFCGQPFFGKGFCKRHQYMRPDFDNRSITQKAIAKRDGSKLSSHFVGEDSQAIFNALAVLEKFFKAAAEEISKTPHCMECGKFIPQKLYRAATAHVLPKRKEFGFPSIASNPNNYLILGPGCGCHSRYDNSWEDAAQMKVFPLAIEKFKILYPLIDKKEYKNIPEVFLQEIL